MISTILNELSVQIVSDPFPKPKQFSNLIRCHQCQSPCTNQFQAFLPSLFHRAPCTNHHAQNTNTKLTGILFLSFHPKPVLKQITITANTNADTKQIKATTKNNRQQAGGIRRTSGPSNGPHSPCPRPSSSLQILNRPQQPAAPQHLPQRHLQPSSLTRFLTP